MPVEGRPLTLVASDGVRLGVTTFEVGEPFANLVIAPAIGVLQKYYSAFARFLAAKGFGTYTFDYRGIGQSKDAPIERTEATLRQWGERDLSAVIAAASASGRPTLVVGHSAGGQLLGLAPEASALAGMLGIATPSAYWGHWSGTGKLRMIVGNYVTIPLVTRLLGYLPLKRFMGAGEPLPRGVALEWAQWSRHPDYVLGYAGDRLPGYQELHIPMRVYGFDDDPIAPPRSIEAWARFFPKANVEVLALTNEQLGGPIGHFGFFRPQWETTLWAEAAHWLRGCAEAHLRRW